MHKSISIVSQELKETVISNRQRLAMSVEDASRRAGIAPKTWTRYEEDGKLPIHMIPRVCKAIDMQSLPSLSDTELHLPSNDNSRLTNLCHWSQYIDETFGEKAALSYAIGSTILISNLDLALQELKVLPKGTHVAELDASLLSRILPSQFAMEYDYEFLSAFRSRLLYIVRKLHSKDAFSVHTVLDELILHIILQLSIPIIACWNPTEPTELDEDWNVWKTSLCNDDDDLESFLYTDYMWLSAERTYHFSHWLKPAFNDYYNDLWFGKVHDDPGMLGSW